MHTFHVIAGWLLFIALAFAYFYWVRPYFKTLPSLANVWQAEATYKGAIMAYLNGRRTILIGLWGEVIAMGPDFLNAIQVLDLKTLLHLPDNWAAYITALIPVLMLIFRTRAAATPPAQY